MTKIRTLPRNSLVGEWKLDGDALDTSGGGNNGTATNVTYAATDRGYQNQAGVFNGSSSSITAGSTFTSVLGISLWIYPTANTKTIATATSITITIDGSSNVTSTGLTSPIYYVNNVVSQALTLNKWNHVVITHSSINYASFNLGVSSFAGNAQGMRIYNKLIIQQEIQSLYMEGLRLLGGASLVPLTDGLVAYWDMNGDAQDIIGGNTGTVTGATLTTDRLGTANRAYNFNRSTQYISVPNTTPIELNTVTVSGWFTLNSTFASDEQGIIRKDTTSTRHLWGMGVVTNTTNLRAQVFNGTSYVTSTYSLTLGTPTYITMVLTGSSGTVSLYVNGVIVGSAVAIGALTAPTSSLTMGCYPDIGSGVTNFTDGKLEEVKISNRALSASEVLALYQISSQRYLTPLLY